jgi:aspartate aminotransferase
MNATAAPIRLSRFTDTLKSETAFDVLAVAKQLKARGKDVIELQIGDSPFPSTRSALAAGKQAIDDHATHYCPSLGLPEFRETLARNYTREFGVEVTAEHIVVGPGAKIFEQYFCEMFIDPGDRVLVFSPQFPTYEPNIRRRGGVVVESALRPEQQFRPNLDDVARFLELPQARAIFLNSPHNPTGGVATRDDLRAISDMVRGRDVAIFSDEPYCHMVWQGQHHTIAAEPDMLEQTLAVYTFSKSYSMSGWRVGYAVTSPRLVQVLGKLVNTSLSCVPPIVQRAAAAAIEHDAAERDEVMQRFRRKVELLVSELQRLPEVRVAMPAGTFYVFPDVSAICQRLRISSHGLAMYLLEGADDARGVACLGGECFGEAGQGFLRFSCAEPDDRLREAVAFLAQSVQRTDRVARYLETHPKYRR